MRRHTLRMLIALLMMRVLSDLGDAGATQLGEQKLTRPQHGTLAVLTARPLSRSDLSSSAQQASGSSPSGQQRAEAEESEIRRDVPLANMKSLIDTALVQNQIVTDLSVTTNNRQLVLDVTLQNNPDQTPWLILINIAPNRYREACQEYEAAGFQRAVDRSVKLHGQLRHFVVWHRPEQQEAVRSLELPPGDLPESGVADAATASLDELMRNFVPSHNIPGATLAVAFRNRLIYSRGFGYADVAQRTPMQPDSLMRIASISKPLTAVAVLQLVQNGQLSLNDRVCELLTDQKLRGITAPADARWLKITVKHLLQHSGGWDRDVSFDPMFRTVEIARHFDLSRPANQADIIRYQLQQPLDFTPGERYAYSNFGYCLLGRIVESITHQSYAHAMSESILRPSGMHATFLGKTRLQNRHPGEVHYHTQRQRSYPAVWERISSPPPRLPKLVSEPYGRWDLEVMDAHGGWIASAPDLLRFVTRLHHDPAPLLNETTLATMTAAPDFVDAQQQSSWYGCGWSVRPAGNQGGCNTWHTGSLAGTSTLLVHRWDGWSWAVLFNIDRTPDGQRCTDLIDPLIHRAVSSIHPIPQTNAFQSTASPTP